MSEQEPHPDSRVLLDYRNRDALDLPRAMLDWRVTEDDMRAVSQTLALIGRQIEAAGIGRFHVPLHATLPPKRLKGGYHHMGTTRMHVDPAQGVVDVDCRVHGIENLFIAGSSVFPTGGYANPTLTIVALAVRLADHLAQGLC
jgi:choline dehydrogenase-like flavoprotein